MKITLFGQFTRQNRFAAPTTDSPDSAEHPSEPPPDFPYT
jgi:hypothetical protein